jgi:hypothetical protein
MQVEIAEGESMNSSPTLQDFVLNLIYDPGARSAFELDPEHALQGAGLGDVTAADVQAVIPLVLDYAPTAAVHGVAGLVATADLTTGVADLDVAGAVAHLQAITAQATLSGGQITGELNVVASAVTVTGDSLLSGGLLPGTDLGLAGIAQIPSLGTGAGAELSVQHDPAVHLDAGVVAPVGGSVTDLVSTTDHLLPHTGVGVGAVGTLDGTLNTVGGLPAVGGLTDSLDLDGLGVHGATSSIVGSLTGPDGVTGVLHDPVEHVHSTVASVDHTVSGVDGGLLGIGHPAEPAEDHGLLGGITDLHF